MTRHPDTATSNSTSSAAPRTRHRRPLRPQRPARAGGPRGESNDVDLMHTVAANAVRCGYLLVGANERVYTRTTEGGDEVARVPRFEEDAVHQLLRRRWLTLGATHRITCGAASLIGTTVLVPTTPAPASPAGPTCSARPPGPTRSARRRRRLVSRYARCATAPDASPTPDRPAGRPTGASPPERHQPPAPGARPGRSR